MMSLLEELKMMAEAGAISFEVFHYPPRGMSDVRVKILDAELYKKMVDNPQDFRF